MFFQLRERFSFWTEEKVLAHIGSNHPGYVPLFALGDDDPQTQLLRAKCFPGADFAQLTLMVCQYFFNHYNNNNIIIIPAFIDLIRSDDDLTGEVDNEFVVGFGIGNAEFVCRIR